MQWSRLKSLVEARQAPSLVKRVKLHQARYRHALEEVGRVWLSIDGKEIAEFATHMGWARIQPLAAKRMDERGTWGTIEAFSQASDEVEAELRAAGVFSDGTALRDLEAYLSLPIEAALVSESPLIRALAVLDARVGKRRLRALSLTPDDHPLVRAMHAVRCNAEGVRLPPPGLG